MNEDDDYDIKTLKDVIGKFKLTLPCMPSRRSGAVSACKGELGQKRLPSIQTMMG